MSGSTKRVYASGRKRYLEFCKQAGVVEFPLAESQLCTYVAYLADQGLRHSSIKGYLSAIRRDQIIHGLGDPFLASWPILECTLKGVKLHQAKSLSSRPKPRLPITPRIMGLLKQYWDNDSLDPDNIMLWAACCSCFFGFLRSGEVTVPSTKDQSIS